MKKLLGALGCVALSMVLVFGTTGCPQKDKAKGATKEKGAAVKEKTTTTTKEKGTTTTTTEHKEKGTTTTTETKEKGATTTETKEKGATTTETKEKVTPPPPAKETAKEKSTTTTETKEKVTPPPPAKEKASPTKEKQSSFHTPAVQNFFALANEQLLAPAYAVRTLERPVAVRRDANA